jgi:hypothetical protein
MMEYRPSFRRKLAGWSLMTVGVAGLVLPLLNGTLFLVFGMFVMRHQYRWANRGIAWSERRWPWMMGKVEQMESGMVHRMRALRRG